MVARSSQNTVARCLASAGCGVEQVRRKESKGQDRSKRALTVATAQTAGGGRRRSSPGLQGSLLVCLTLGGRGRGRGRWRSSTGLQGALLVLLSRVELGQLADERVFRVQEKSAKVVLFVGCCKPRCQGDRRFGGRIGKMGATVSVQAGRGGWEEAGERRRTSVTVAA